MDFWARLLGGSYSPKKPPANHSNDPQSRFSRFKRVLTSIQHICNQKRDIALEQNTLDELRKLFERLAILIREETRAPAPHLCLQYTSSHQITTIVNRAAAVSFDEGCIRAAITFASALVDSEEEDFVSNAAFAKSLIRLVTRVVDGGNVLISMETETSILELLFTIAAKIRLQPEVLPFWFSSTSKAELDDVFVKERQTSFVGITFKNDFPLCYLLVDRVHHEGRIGDFARTGLLYIFEATGRSPDLEDWILRSDLMTLLASGLGALYSQLNRELSILHPDATLPPVLAMSDYSTTHSEATAESAFSEKHQAHISTFLSYLEFWQDILDHCKSSDVKQSLLDHFQILFLQQLLYPSILQSSDTDAGSSVAVLTYLTSIINALDYPQLIHNLLTYLLAIHDRTSDRDHSEGRPSMAPRSPSALRTRESLILMTTPKDPNDTVEPVLFSVVDLIQNSLSSNNSQTVFSALRLATSLVTRHKRYAFQSLIKVESVGHTKPSRTVGALRVEFEEYLDLASRMHNCRLDDIFLGLSEDIRLVIEAQVPLKPDSTDTTLGTRLGDPGYYMLVLHDAFIRNLLEILRTFFTNGVEVNLALTQALISIACCTEVRLDRWLALDPASYSFAQQADRFPRSWQNHLDADELASWEDLQQAARKPLWSSNDWPQLYTILAVLTSELDTVRHTTPDLDHLVATRKYMLQAANDDASSDITQSLPDSPLASREHNGSASQAAPSQASGRMSEGDERTPPSASKSQTSPSVLSAQSSEANEPSAPPLTPRAFYQPPPAEMPSTTDVLMQEVAFTGMNEGNSETNPAGQRSSSLNHVLTNVVVLQHFVLELVAVLHARSAVLREAELRV